MIDPLVDHDVINSGSLSRVIVQDLCDEVSGRVANRSRLREAVGVHTDALVGRLHIGRLEGRLTDDERVDDDADGPDVDLVRVALLAFEHLGSDIVRSTANSALALAIKLELGSEAEVTDFDLHLVVEEEVAEFEVTMDDSVRV